MDEIIVYLQNLTKSLDPPANSDPVEEQHTYRLWSDLNKNYDAEHSNIAQQFSKLNQQQLLEKAKELELRVIELDIRQSNEVKKGIL